MKKIVLLVCFLYGGSVFSQQDPSITTYMFNTLAFNPAYAGSQDFLTINFLNRSQWLGWSDDQSRSPNTQILSAHSPFNKRVGLGVHLSSDVIGVSRTTTLNTAYAYRIAFPFGDFSIGLQAGFINWKSDWSKLTFKDGASFDPSFNQMQSSRLLPNFGFGAYFQSEYYYVGVSLPRLLEMDLTRPENFNDAALTSAKLYRHFYFTAGGILPILSNNLVFKPSLLIRKVGGFGQSDLLVYQGVSPTSIDLDASLLFLETLWLGISYRWTLEGKSSSHDSFDFWAAFYLKNGFRLGLAYDIGLTPIRKYSNGSLELMVGYDFNFNVSNVQSPRYF